MAKPKNSIRKNAARFGLYLGLILVLGTITAYNIDWDLIMSRWFQPSKLIVALIVAVYSCYYSKKNNPDKYSFRDAFSAYFIPIAIGLFLFLLANYIIFNLYDAEAGHYLSQMSIEEIKHLRQQMGDEPEKIKQIVEDLKNSNQFSFANQFKGYFFNLTLYAVFGAIVALIFKKKKPIII